MRKWKCSICDYVHEGDNPPGECPHCESIAEVFSEQSNKKGNVAKPEQLEKKEAKKPTTKKKTTATKKATTKKKITTKKKNTTKKN